MCDNMMSVNAYKSIKAAASPRAICDERYEAKTQSLRSLISLMPFIYVNTIIIIAPRTANRIAPGEARLY